MFPELGYSVDQLLVLVTLNEADGSVVDVESSTITVDFDPADDRPRLYVLNIDGELFEVDPDDFSASGVLGTGPTPVEGVRGWSGLAGPLSDCETGFTPPR